MDRSSFRGLWLPSTGHRMTDRPGYSVHVTQRQTRVPDGLPRLPMGYVPQPPALQDPRELRRGR